MSWLNGGKILRRGFGLSTDELRCAGLGMVSTAMSFTSALIFYVLLLTENNYHIGYLIATVAMVFLTCNNVVSVRDRIRRHRFRTEEERRRLRFVVTEIEEEKCRGEA